VLCRRAKRSVDITKPYTGCVLWLWKPVQGSVLSDLGDLRTSMSGGSSWIGHGTAMGPDR
jgi:hypothetical protein